MKEMWDEQIERFCCSVTQSCLTLCDPMDCSTPGFPVLHHLLEFARSHPLNQWCHPTSSSSGPVCMSNSGWRPRLSIYLPPLLPMTPGHARTTPQQSALISLLSTSSLPSKRTHTLFSSSGCCVLPTLCASWNPTVHSTQQSAQNS